ncbi:MAG: tetratricopeptide repeat protein, partial [Gemmataceae bacterium]
YQRLALLHDTDRHNTTDAARTLDRMVQANPQSAEALLSRARYHAAQEKQRGPAATDPVLQDLRQAHTLAKSSADVIISLAERHLKHRDVAAAQTLLTEAIKQNPPDARVVRLAAWLDVCRGNLGGAIATLDDGVTRAKDNSELLIPLADLLLQVGDVAQTEAISAKLERRGHAVSKLQAKYLRARLAMHAQNWPTAIEQLSKLRSEATGLPALDQQALQLLSICHQWTGEAEKEREALTQLLVREPHNATSRQALAASYLRAGLLTEALREYELGTQSPDAPATIYAGFARLRLRSLALAPRPSQREYAELDNDLRQNAPRFGGSSEVVLLRSQLHRQAGQPQSAIELLRQELSRQPADARLWVQLADTVATSQGTVAAHQVLDDAYAAGRDGPDFRLARARLLMSEAVPTRPFSSLDTKLELWPEADRERYLAGRIELALALADLPQSLQLYDQLLASRPDDLRLWESHAALAAQAKDAARLARARSQLTRLGGEASGALILTDAWAAWAAGQPAEVTTLLEKRFGEKPMRAEACLLRGLAARATGTKPDLWFERAARLEPASFEVQRWYLWDSVQHDATLADARFDQLRADPKWQSGPLDSLL